MDSNNFQSYVPVYDAIPDQWNDAQQFLTEALKQISNAVNIREIGWYLDEPILTAKPFIPVSVPFGDNSPQQFRQVIRKVIDTGPLILGVNPGIPHGITFDVNFTLVQMWVSGTNSTTFYATTISNWEDLSMDATNINIISPGVLDRSFCVIEYLLEI